MTKPHLAAPKTLITLEQFAALEAWMEAKIRLAAVAKGELHAPLVTDAYAKRQRAMVLLTGAKPPVIDPKEDDCELA